MISIPDQGFVYPKTGLDVDLRFDTTPTYVSTGSYFLDGTGDYIQTDGLTVTTDQSDFSFSFWMKVDESLQVSIWRPFGFRNSSTTDRIELWHQSGAFKLLTNNGDGDVLATAWTVADVVYENVWSHFAFSCDWNGSAMNCTLYINGQSLGAVAMESDVDLSAANKSAIGGGNDGGSSILGNIAHFGVWHAALTQAQVRDLMTASTYAEAVAKGGSTPRAYYLLEADVNISAGTGTGRPNGTAQGNAAPVGNLVRLPSGLDLTGNRNAQVFSGRAWGTDGAGDYLSLGSPGDLDGFFNTGGTFAGWFNVATVSHHYEKIFDLGTATTLSLQAGMSGYIFTKDWSTTDGNWTYNGSGGAPLGMWFHLVLSYNAASTGNDPALYINGVLQTIDGETAPEGSAAADTSNKFLGIYNNGSDNPYDGEMADVKFITSTVTAAQALEMYKNPEQILPTGISSSALKCWLPLCDYDIAAATTVGGLYFQDASGNGNHALSTNGAMSFNHPVAPQMGLRSSTSRILFDGADGKVTVGNNAAINGLFGSGGSIAFWLNAFSDGEGNYGRIIETGGWKIFVQLEASGSVQIRFDHIFSPTTGTWKAPTASIAVGTWNHVVVTYSGASIENDPVIYINGSSVAVSEAPKPDGTVNADTADKLFGSDPTDARTFHGFISEVAFYKGTILDADAVTVMYNGGVQGFDLLTDSGNYDNSGDVDGLWVLDNPVTIQDLSTNSNTGAVSGSPNIATVPESATADLSSFGNLTRKHYSGMLSGVNVFGRTATGSASAGCGAILPTPDMGTGDWTISFWFRMMQPASTDMSLIYSYDASIGFDMFFTGSTKLNYTVKGSTTAGTSLTGYATLTVADYVEKWCHVVYRREGTSVISHYFKPLDAAAITAGDMDDSTEDIGSISASEPYFGIGVSTRSGSMFYANAAGADFAFFRICVGDAWTDAQVNATHEQGARMLRGT